MGGGDGEGRGIQACLLACILVAGASPCWPWWHVRAEWLFDSCHGRRCCCRLRGGCRLYQDCGFVEAEAWVDEAWARDAERGRPGKARRVLMVRPLREPPPAVAE